MTHAAELAGVDATVLYGLEAYPHDAAVFINLDWLLATCPDEKLRNPAKAIELAETPRKLTGRPGPVKLRVPPQPQAMRRRLKN